MKNSKEKFIEFVENHYDELDEGMKTYFEFTIKNGGKEKSPITEKGAIILEYLKGLPDDSWLTSTEIASNIEVLSSRTVSGSIRKLVSDGLVERQGEKPVKYCITEDGKNFKLN